MLSTSLIRHGFSPDGLCLATIIPIPKNARKSLNDSDNYRGIALSSVIGKMIDWVILNNNCDILRTSDLQFAYKSQHSTVQCTFLANEVIQYYRNGGGNVYALLLDASKAFDRIEYVKLFKLLLQKGCCPLTARFIAVLYSSQSVRVRWTDFLSNSFTISNGVKQGGVLSPVLFTVYYDELLMSLKTSDAGCHIGNTFMGALSYADDLVLLCPTKASLNILMSICTKFSNEYKVSFNPAKSKLIVFGAKTSDCTMRFDGDDIQCVDSDKHLGSQFGNKVMLSQIESAIGDLYNRCNLLLSQFSKVSSHVKYRLFKTFCMSVYGCVLWDFSNPCVDKFFTAWRKCIRRIFSIPYNSHCRFLSLLCEDLPVDCQLHIRFLKFYQQCLVSNNNCLRLCSILASNGSRSNVCRSLNFLCDKYNVHKETIITCSMSDIYQHVSNAAYSNIIDHDIVSVGVLIDSICTRDRRDFSVLSLAELNLLIEHIATV